MWPIVPRCPGMYRRCGTMGRMASKGKPSPRSAVRPLSDAQVAKLAAQYDLVDPTRPYPTGRIEPNEQEINEQNPKLTGRLMEAAPRCCAPAAGCAHGAWRTCRWTARTSPPPPM